MLRLKWIEDRIREEIGPTERSWGSYQVFWTGYKVSLNSETISGQWLGKPDRELSDLPRLYVGTGGQYGPYQKGDYFDVSHREGWPLLEVGEYGTEEPVRSCERALHLLYTLIDLAEAGQTIKYSWEKTK